MFQCIFLVWCMLPIQWNGSNILYYRFIKPFILRHEGEIDRTIRDAKESAKSAVNAGLSNGEIKFDLSSVCWWRMFA